MSAVVDLLLAARDRILDPDDWWAGPNTTSIARKRVGSYCAITAITALVGTDEEHRVGVLLLDEAARPMLWFGRGAVLGPYDTGWLAALVNDHLGFEAVHSMYDEAIRLAKDADQ